MSNCDRCHTKLIEGDVEAAPVPVTYGETDIVICYRCAVELTIVIGFWLGTEPQADPKAWVRGLVET